MQGKSLLCAAAVCTMLLMNWAASARAADPCDRACLEEYIDKVIDATIAHNPRQLMLAKDIRYTENGVELILGDGLWGTATARGKYKLYVSDPGAGQADQIEAVINGVPYRMKSEVWDK